MVLGKAIGGAAFVGLLGVGGVAIAKPEWMGMADPMPTWHSLHDDSDFSTKKETNGNNGYKDGMGKKYSRYLVGVTDSKNKDWWEWSFRRLERDKKSDNSKPGAKFKDAKPYSTSVNEAINKICEAAYKANHTSDFLTASENDDGNKYKEDDVWKYCSPGPLVLVGDNEYGSGKIGGGTDKATLVSVKNSANDWFWDMRNKDFWEVTDGEWSSSKSTNGSNKSVFKVANEDKDKAGTTRKTIKQLCEDAYKKDSANTDPNVTDAKRFCALKVTA